MVTSVSTGVAPPGTPTSTPVIESATFDERWAAWQAKGGRAHGRAVRQRMAIAAPILLVVVAVGIYALLGR
jgi:hypothetical protein